MGINLNQDITNNAKQGWKWYLNSDNPSLETKMISHLEINGCKYLIQKNEIDHKAELVAIQEKLILEPEKIIDVKNILNIYL